MAIPKEKWFKFEDGDEVKNLEELMKKLERISYESFYNHVNDTKNDFANWAEHVFGEEELAESLRKVTSIVETVEVLNDFLNPQEEGLEDEELDDIQEMIEEELDIPPPIHPSTSDKGAEAEKEAAEKSKEKESGRKVEKKGVGTVETEAEFAEDVREAEAETASASQMTKFIVKEFIIGMLFGLILGLILGRILSM